MNNETIVSLSSLKEILDTLPTESFTDPQKENLITAQWLTDLMLVNQTESPRFETDYVSQSKALLRTFVSEEGETLSDEIRDLIEKIQSVEEDSKFSDFQLLLSRLLIHIGDADNTKYDQLGNKLALLEYEFSQSLMNAALAIKPKDGKSAASGAVNVKEIDEAKLEAFLVREFSESAKLKIENTHFISGGHSKFTLGVQLVNAATLPDTIILRGEASNRFSGAGVKEEYLLQKILFENNVMIPEPLALEETGEVFGAPFLLCRKANGTIIGHMFQLPSAKNLQISEDIARHLARIHQIPTEVFNTDVDNAGCKTSQKVHQWLDIGYRDLHETGLNSTVFERSFSWLRKNAEINDKWPQSLVHGDYGLNNILIDENKVTAILDWEFAHIGNPAYDLAYFYFMAESLSSWSHFLASYEGGGGRLPDAEQLNYNILFAATRLGVMTGQTHSAIVSGQVKGSLALRVISHQYFNESIQRIYGALERVLF